MTQYEDYQFAIDELQNNLNGQFEGIDAIKAFARTLMGSSSIVVALLSALQIFLSSSPSDRFWYWVYVIGVVFALAIYVCLVVFCIKILSPTDMHRPLRSDWDVIREKIIHLSGDDLRKMQISAYLNAISKNEKAISSIREWAKRTSYLLPAMIVIMLLLSLIPR